MSCHEGLVAGAPAPASVPSATIATARTQALTLFVLMRISLLLPVPEAYERNPGAVCEAAALPQDSLAALGDLVDAVGVDGVPTRAAGDHVALPVAGVDPVVAVAAGDDVAAGPQIDRVVPPVSLDRVVSGTGVDDVGPRLGTDRVGAGRAGE